MKKQTSKDRLDAMVAAEVERRDQLAKIHADAEAHLIVLQERHPDMRVRLLIYGPGNVGYSIEGPDHPVFDISPDDVDKSGNNA